MIALRQLISWHEDARANRLRPAITGGAAGASWRPSPPTCHDCDFTGDAEVVLQHMWSEHGRDRRKRARAA